MATASSSRHTDHYQDETTSLLNHSQTAGPSRKLPVLIVCSLFVLFSEFSYFATSAPQTEIFEQIICRDYYAISVNGTSNTTISAFDTNLCKSEVVQSELALLNGWKDMFDTLPSILFSLPYGILSDRWGRKPVMLMGIAGVLLGHIWTRVVCLWPKLFPIRLVWASGIWGVIGGGNEVLQSIALVMVADVFSEQERASSFFILSGAVFVAQILATPLSAYLMTIDPWLPYLIALAVEVLGCSLALFLPETLDIAKSKKDTGSVVTAEEEDEPSKGPTTLSGQLGELKRLTNFIWKDLNVMLTIFVLLVATMNKQSINLLLQYTSKKFDWSLARASLLACLHGAFALVNYLALMPFLTFIATKYFHLETAWKDLWLARTSGFLAIVGFILVALAYGPAVLIFGLIFLSLGSAFEVTSRSLGTSLVLPDHIGTLYSAAAIVTAVGKLVAGPLFAYLLGVGMSLGNVWMGLPFLVVAVFYSLTLVALGCIKLRRAPSEDDELPLLYHST